MNITTLVFKTLNAVNLYRKVGHPGRIFHCCVQKTASQWFSSVFSNPAFQYYSGYKIFYPDFELHGFNEEDTNVLSELGQNNIISPLYCGHEPFQQIRHKSGDKVFVVLRDPRDLVVSNYFSMKYSHPDKKPGFKEIREKLNKLSQEDGISYVIELLQHSHFKSIQQWLNAYKNGESKFLLIKYEDFFGENHYQMFQQLLEYVPIDLPSHITKYLLKKYSFESLSGRKPGQENQKSHFRKGKPGDWVNYLNDMHIKSINKYVVAYNAIEEIIVRS